MNSWSRILVSGLPILDSRIRILDSGFIVLDSRIMILNSWSRISAAGFRSPVYYLVNKYGILFNDANLFVST